MKRLIVNADGFGFGPGATQGVLDALGEGKFITSVSVNVNFQDAERIRELAEIYPHVSIGVHLNPMVGRPCLSPEKVSSLVGPDGNMHGKKFLRLLGKGLVAYPELESELDAQIAKAKELVGDRLTHLDSQANSHLFYFDLFLRLARKWGMQRMRNNASLICLEAKCPSRSRSSAYLRSPHIWIAHRYRRYQMEKARRNGLRMAGALITVGYAGTGNKTNIENWRRLLHHLPEGTFEIYCHPAYPDTTLRRWAGYCDERMKELTILRQRVLGDEAAKAGVTLISFNDI